MIVLIDNYDSFTFNLFHYLGGLGADVVVHRNDKISVDEVIAHRSRRHRALARPLHAERSRHLPRARSPRRRRPFRSSACASAIRPSARPSAATWCARRCLCTASSRASSTGQRRVPRHQCGRSRPRAIIRWSSTATACRPISTVTAETDDRLVMGLAHTTLPVHGVQFHPESIASEHGHLILRNFLDIAAAWNAATGRRDRASDRRRAARRRAAQ